MVQPAIVLPVGIRSWAVSPPVRSVQTLLYGLPILALLVLTGTVGARYQQDRAERSASYATAEIALAAGDYDAALHGFAGASGFRDADRRHDALQKMLRPYRLSYLEGVAALEARRYDDAIAALSPVARDLPDYEDVSTLLAKAQHQRDAELLGSIATAERRRDWLAAEQTLATLAAGHPEDGDLAERLRLLRQTRAPLAVARDDGLYLIGPDGSDQRLLTSAVPAAMPAWDPARTRIAFLSVDPTRSNRAANLYVISGEGHGLTKLATGLITGTVPVWNPAGDHIAYSRVAGGIGLVDLETGAESDITNGLLGTAISPTWSPDGRMLALIHLITGEEGRPASEVLIVDVNTGTVTTLPGRPLADAARLAWNPMDSRLLVYRARLDASSGPESTGIALIDLATGEREDIARGSRLALPPVWSPDGTRIAYVESDATVRIRRPGTLSEAVITVAHPLSGDLIWAPGGSALLALAAQPSHPSFLIPLTTRAGGDGPGSARAVELGNVVGNGDNGPPSWSGTHLPKLIPPTGTEET
ncbi:MAG TPA: hypothetical protein VGR16_10035 [Thermomicrobiales bacterium]|nr:hypothetical protein [Thermomicrobiales bacterium]